MIARIMKVALVAAFIAAPALAVDDLPVLVNSIVVPGETPDLYTGAAGANYNRLGGPFSDLFYDRQNHALYGLVDRGPGGGLISYETRIEKLKVNVNQKTGAISSFRLQLTILFRTADGSEAFNGLHPGLLNGDKSILGLSFDPEGIAVSPDGRVFVSDEYGPSVYEFKLVEVSDEITEARFVRALEIPANLIPKEGAALNYVDGRGILTSGRQDNRGFEGITITPDGTTLYAVLQDPLILEGPSNEGRRGRNVRIVAFDVESGKSVGQYIYQLETVTDINARIPGTANDFGATAQGRNIGLSAITAINNTEFLVIERDNRGIGVEDALQALPVGSKRVYRIDISDATDASEVSLTGTNALPADVVPVAKTLFIDIAAALQSAGMPVGEKWEGLVIGPQLKNGLYAILTGTDNDFSVTQSGAGEQFDVYTNGTTGPIDGPAMGRSLIPIFMLSFAADVPGFVAAAKH